MLSVPVLLCLAFVASTPALAESSWRDGLWRTLPHAAQTDAPDVRAERYLVLELNLEALKARLLAAPLERAPGARPSLELPLPDGSFARVAVAESPILAPELQQAFPELRTYLAQSTHADVAGRFDVTPVGLHAQLFTATGRVFIDPYRRGDTGRYVVYATGDARRAEPRKPFTCGFEQLTQNSAARRAQLRGQAAPFAPSGATLRTYRLALAGTGEYTAAVCAPSAPAVACGLAGMVTSMNRVNGIYERELAVRMVLVPNNNLLVFTDPVTDGYTNDDGFTMLDENQAKLDAVIGSANYDIGHVFSTGGGGVAGLGVVCSAGEKGAGVTGRGTPIGDPFDVDYVAHEMGHQFGGNHTFNGTTGSCCCGNRNGGTAWEPGSGSTIMAYAGICGAEDLQPNSDPTFHVGSFDEMSGFITGPGNACAVSSATGNGAPTVNAGPARTIPSRTPFTLTGSATDPQGDALVYLWEEFDLGAAAPPNTDNGNRPIFRSFVPLSTPARTFPRLSDILANTSTFGEALPTTTRTMTFRLTARDNRAGGGGVDYASATVNVVGTAGPFQVTAPNTAVTWTLGSSQPVTWNVASTNAAPINCANVNLLLSYDGGQTYPVTLAAATPNDGSENITVPGVTGTTQARVRVECAGNVFFDVSNVNFTIGAVPVELQRFGIE
jgi:hypothetical protein